MYCKNCGRELDDSADICPYCGNKCATAAKSEPDGSSIGYALLGFFIPIVGLVLYLIWKNEYPLRAKSAGKGALISVVIGVVVGIIYGIIAAVAIGNAMSYMAMIM